MNNKALSVIKFFIGWPVSILSLYFVFRIINPKFSVILPLVKNINIYTAFLSVICLLIYFILRGYLWKLILKTNGYNFSLKDTMFNWGISELKRYTPGNIWAFLARTFSFSNKGVDKKTIIKSLVSEGVLVTLGSILVSLFSITFVFNFFQLGNKGFLQTLIILFSFVLVLFYVFGNGIINTFPSQKIRWILSLFMQGKAPEKLYMLLVSAITMFFFGLGSYFVMYSFFTISVSKIFVYTGFFTLSLLVGYLSLITPMGLGVREWIITIGLSSVLSISGAGLVSILSRLFFIFSEILFLILAWFWTVLKSDYVKKTEHFLIRNKHKSILFLLMLIYLLYFSTASFLRYDNFYTGRFDLGNMDQVVWNTAEGRTFQLTDPNGTNITTRLEYHSDFILILLSPFYFIWQNPKMLLFIQTLILALGAYYIFLIADHLLKNKNISLVFAFIYLINPAVNYTNLYDFHPVTLATAFYLAAIYYLIRNRKLLFAFVILLAALCKEQLWLTSGLFFLYFAAKEYVSNKSASRVLNTGFGLLGAIFSFIFFYVLLWIIIPKARGGEHFALSYYAEFGKEPFEMVSNILLNPLRTLSIMFSSERVLYLSQLFLPLGLLSLASPFYISFASPDLLVNLLSSNPQLHQIYYQYSSTITPFVFVSAIFGAKVLLGKIKLLKINHLIAYILITGLFFAYLYGPLPGAVNANLDMFDKPLENRKLVSEFISSIPKEYSVSATNNLGSHLSRRKFIYTIPVGIDNADIVAFLLNDSYAQPTLKEQKLIAETFEYNNNYVLLIKDRDFVAFKRINILD